MSFDIHLLCMLQKKATTSLTFSSGICLEARNQNSCDFPKGINTDIVTSTSWKTMNAIQGIWYYAFVPNPSDPTDTFLGSYYLCDMRDDAQSIYVQKDTIEKSACDYVNEFGSLLIRDAYQNDFKRLVKSLIDMSPINTIAFLARYQDIHEEHMSGTYTMKSFLSMLDSGKVSFNVCYIIRSGSI